MSPRLAKETSAYLRSAAGSPIDWYPWGGEAFERARREDKPILLDIGAVWCHWCHVMDHGTYEDTEVVRRLNEDYVCIKVDRDERPDVDIRYQRAVGALAGQGGWPLTAFLTPDGKVFFGGTYFPPQDAHGRAGFRSVLEQITRVYKEDRARVDDSAEHIASALKQAAERAAPPAPLDGIDLGQVAAALVKAHDQRFGGFGGAPKFPHASAIRLALALGQARGDAQLVGVAERTLQKMAAGGIHDHVGGGFHRYSVDAHWTVPHFEKMAYDNAALLAAYVDAYARTGTERYREVAEGILRWVLGECADPDGGFAASQDADVGPHDDGDYFTWTLKELEAALRPTGADASAPDERHLLEIARLRFGVAERGDMHHDPARNVLEHEMPVDEVARTVGLDEEAVRRAEAEILRRLKRARDAREAPFIDRTRYTQWNAMYVSACLAAGAVLGHAPARDQAVRTLDRLVAEHWDAEKGWLHGPRGAPVVGGLLEDQVWMGLALLDAYTMTGEHRYLERAVHTAEMLLAHYAAEQGGFHDLAVWARTAAEAAPLAEPDRPWLDQSGPGPNPLAARLLLRLGRLTENERFVQEGRRALEAFAGEAPRMGVFASTWWWVVHEHLSDPPLVTVVGAADDPTTTALLDAARAAPRLGRLVVHAEPGATAGLPSYLQDVVGNEDLVKEGPRALVCYGDRCEALLADPDELRGRLLGIPPEA